MKEKKNILIICAVLFLVLTALVYYHASFIISFDQAISDITVHLRSPSLDQKMVIITSIGNISRAIFIFILFAVILIVKRKKYSLYILTFATVLSPILAGLFKIMVERMRPPLVSQIIIKETDPSFPSGHATISTVFLLASIILIAPAIKNRILQKVFLIITIILFPLIALSRIYLSVHFASDVIGGVFLGIICYSLADIFVIKYIKK